MAQMLTRMERDGLIRRTPDPADGRSARVFLTEAAEARLPAAIACLLQGNREALEGFTDGEAAQLVALLTRLTVNLDRIASVDAPPGARLRPRLEKKRAASVLALRSLKGTAAGQPTAAR